MQENFLVISHYFIGLGTLLFFLLALISPKGKPLHKLFGKLFLMTYSILIVFGFLAGTKYDFFEDKSLKFMLWAQAVFCISLLILGYSSIRYKHRPVFFQKLNLVSTLTSILVSISVLILGIIKAQPISISLCSSFILISLCFLRFIFKHQNKPINHLYYHATAFVTAGVFLTYNATGFYGIHDVYDVQGYVNWSRTLKSFVWLFTLLTAINLVVLKVLERQIYKAKHS
jgi:hypothetical protein